MFLTKHFVNRRETSEVDDIIRNLGFIFSSKRGVGYFIESFGLTDAGYRTNAEMVMTITKDITDNVRRFEQRVELLGIDEQYTDEGRARLIVNLRVRDGKQKLKLTVDLADRTFDIKPEEAPKK